jgi:hypothetical protein
MICTVLVLRFSENYSKVPVEMKLRIRNSMHADNTRASFIRLPPPGSTESISQNSLRKNRPGLDCVGYLSLLQSLSAEQYNSLLLWNSKDHHHVHKILYLKIYFCTIFPFSSRCWKWFLRLKCSDQSCVYIVIISCMRATRPSHLVVFDLMGVLSNLC